MFCYITENTSSDCHVYQSIPAALPEHEFPISIEFTSSDSQTSQLPGLQATPPTSSNGRQHQYESACTSSTSSIIQPNQTEPYVADNPAKMVEALVMSKEHRKILRDNRTTLESELQAVQLLNHLSEVLSQKDYENVMEKRDPIDQARALLDMLPGKGSTAFDCFVKALWKVQSHLARKLSEAAGLKVSP